MLDLKYVDITIWWKSYISVHSVYFVLQLIAHCPSSHWPQSCTQWTRESVPHSQGASWPDSWGKNSFAGYSFPRLWAPRFKHFWCQISKWIQWSGYIIHWWVLCIIRKRLLLLFCTVIVFLQKCTHPMYGTNILLIFPSYSLFASVLLRFFCYKQIR